MFLFAHRYLKSPKYRAQYVKNRLGSSGKQLLWANKNDHEIIYMSRIFRHRANIKKWRVIIEPSVVQNDLLSKWHTKTFSFVASTDERTMMSDYYIWVVVINNCGKILIYVNYWKPHAWFSHIRKWLLPRLSYIITQWNSYMSDMDDKQDVWCDVVYQKHLVERACVIDTLIKFYLNWVNRVCSISISKPFQIILD